MSRTRPHVKIHLSIVWHDKTAGAWANLEQRGMIAEILRTGVDQFAPKRGGRVSLMPADRIRVACTDLQTSDRMIEELCTDVGWRIDKHRNRWTVTVRNLAIKQGIGGQESSTKADGLSPERPPQKAESRKQRAENRTGVSDGFALDGGGRPKVRTRVVEECAIEVYPAVRAAFAEHGKVLGDRLGFERGDQIAKRMHDGATPREIVAAVHGYVQLHGGLTVKPDGWDPRPFFRPETVFREKGFQDLVEKGLDPQPIPPRGGQPAPKGTQMGDWPDV